MNDSRRCTRGIPAFVGTAALTALLAHPLAVQAGPASPAPATTVPSARAAALADDVMKSLGGDEAWRNTRYLRFDFGAEHDGVLSVRSHTWDKYTGRYRLEAKTREGDPYVVLMSLNTRQGQAWRKGQKLSGEDEKKQLEQAYGAWVNDTYWLLMPYKLKDPGVILSDAGTKTENGITYDVIALSFAGVGLTPKDRYWVYVNRNTHLVDRWDFVLKGENKPPTTFTWKGWTKKGGIMLASERVDAKDKLRLLFPVLETPASVPDSVFTTP